MFSVGDIGLHPVNKSLSLSLSTTFQIISLKSRIDPWSVFWALNFLSKHESDICFLLVSVGKSIGYGILGMQVLET